MFVVTCQLQLDYEAKVREMNELDRSLHNEMEERDENLRQKHRVEMEALQFDQKEELQR